MLNAYLTPMTEIIHAHHGTVDKYVGDAIMAFWGAPIDNPNHARDAVLAALAMQRRMSSLAREFKKRGWPELVIGVGINTGAMNVGDMGSEFRKAYTVLGDAVNLASRLEGLTKEYGVAVIIGEDARAAVPDIRCREIDRVRVGRRTRSRYSNRWRSGRGRVQTNHDVGKALLQYRSGACRWRPRFPPLPARIRPRVSTLFRPAERPSGGAAPDWDGATNFATK
jgi:adenylate cyclase